jgi:hypothetical protein
MIPASDIYQSSPDWTITVVYYHFRWNPMDAHTIRISHFLFFTTMSISPQGSDFFFIDLAIIIKDTKNQGATCTTSNATRVRAHRGSGSISRGLVFLPIRDTQCLFPFGMTRASESKLYARRRIATNEEGSTGHGDYLLF